MPLTLINRVILDGQYVRFEGSTEFPSDLQDIDLDLYIVAMQEGVVVRDKWTISAGVRDWTVMALMDEPRLAPGAVTTTGLTVVQISDPVGFRTFTWTQNLLASQDCADASTEAAPRTAVT